MGIIIDLFMFILYLFIGATPLVGAGIFFFLVFRYLKKTHYDGGSWLD